MNKTIEKFIKITTVVFTICSVLISPAAYAASSSSTIYYSQGSTGYNINPSGTAKQLTTQFGLKQNNSAVSPSGSRVAYTDASSQKAVISNLDGSAASALTFTYGGQLLTHYTWAPNGQRVAFVAYDRAANVSRIVTANADGSNAVVLPGNPASQSPTNRIQTVDWLSNSTLVYMPLRGSSQSVLCRVDATSGAQSGCFGLPVLRSQTGGSDKYYDYMSFAVSPSRTQISYVADRDMWLMPYSQNELALSNADGSNFRSIAKAPKVDYLHYDTIVTSLWSSDSAAITYCVLSISNDGNVAPSLSAASGLWTIQTATTTKKALDTGKPCTLNAWL